MLHFFCYFFPAAEQFCQFVKQITACRFIGSYKAHLMILRPRMRQPFCKLPLVGIRTIHLIICICQLYLGVAICRSDLCRQQLCHFNCPSLLIATYDTDQPVCGQIQRHRHLIQHFIIVIDILRLVLETILYQFKTLRRDLDRYLKRHIANS